jgi:hypothetical protein
MPVQKTITALILLPLFYNPKLESAELWRTDEEI